MPIILDPTADAGNVNLANVYTPKFFDKSITGNGGMRGLLSKLNNPIPRDASGSRIPANTERTMYDDCITHRRRSYTNAGSTVTDIPLDPLTADAWNCISKMPYPNYAKHPIVARDERTINGIREKLNIRLGMIPINISTCETNTTNTATGQSSTQKKHRFIYRVFLISTSETTDTADPATVEFKFFNNPQSIDMLLSTMSAHSRYCKKPEIVPHRNACIVSWVTVNPAVELEQMVKQMITSGPNTAVDNVALQTYLDLYSLYDGVEIMSEFWQTEKITNLFDILVNNIYNQNRMVTNNLTKTMQFKSIVSVLHHLEDYNIPLPLYPKIYQSIRSRFAPSDTTILCKENLNLLLNDTLNELQTQKSILPVVTKNPATKIDPKFSMEQLDAITTDEPLAMVSAGAGSGKSTVVIGRIDYMLANNIKPSDIFVVSFTHAAANNIRDRYSKKLAATPGQDMIRTMTMGAMIEAIYHANYPDHQTCDTLTMVNCLKAYFSTNNTAIKLANKLRGIEMDQKDTRAIVSLSNFVELHLTEIINILDQLQRTCYQLEIILCYLLIDSFKEPPEVAHRYLIMDEVQDNSVLEFIYTMKYVNKHKSGLFIVGDPSQTLYEFRAANPKCLTVLEGSGVFDTYALQINYRSRQSILALANKELDRIDANQFSHIQLQANNMVKPTATEFQDTVKLHYEPVRNAHEFNDRIPSIIGNQLRTYIDDCLARGEQVAFLSYTRKMSENIEQIITGSYPGKNMVSLVPKPYYTNTIFSDFIVKWWNTVTYVNTKNFAANIAQCINSKAQELCPRSNDPKKAEAIVATHTMAWFDKYNQLINAQKALYESGNIQFADLIEFVKTTMLDFETTTNNERRTAVQRINEERKNQDLSKMNFIFSTIHSVKGQEFDNVIVFYHNDNNKPEDVKRMHYVALTRAKNTEFVVAYDKVKKANIVSDYENIVAQLKDADTAKAAAAVAVVAQPSTAGVGASTAQTTASNDAT